jgi:nucleotide-binding universal stress UspA family protein
VVRKIVLPLDLDHESSWRKALPTAVDFARRSGAQLHVMTVVPDEHVKMAVVAQLIPEGYEQRIVDDAKQRLAALLKQHAPDDLEIQQSVRRGSIYKEILRYTRDTQADLVIMAAHRPEMRDYLLGPNAARIVRHADCSVWVVRE